MNCLHNFPSTSRDASAQQGALQVIQLSIIVKPQEFPYFTCTATLVQLAPPPGQCTLRSRPHNILTTSLIPRRLPVTSPVPFSPFSPIVDGAIPSPPDPRAARDWASPPSNFHMQEPGFLAALALQLGRGIRGKLLVFVSTGGLRAV